MELEEQFLIVVFHVSNKLLPQVQARGLGYNAYNAEVVDDDGKTRLEDFLAISFVIDATGVDLSNAQIDEHAIAKGLGVPPIEDWEWHFEVCSEDALPAGTYWIGDISSVACQELQREIPGFDEVRVDTMSGDLIRSIESFPGLFYAVLPCKESSTTYVDVECGDTYQTQSRCIGIIPKSLMSEEITPQMDMGGDYLISPLEIPVKYDGNSGRILLGSIELGGVTELAPLES